MINADVFKDGRVAVYQQTVSDSVRFERIRFKFPDSWSGYAKTAVFRHKDTVINVILDPENELCTGENECYIPFFGTMAGRRYVEYADNGYV